ncbi:unnamed protein product [Pseudo-nitzschia multistriata]|uniref:Uncharacterized protein n=1 Tax=Pseudo-nitzschia multistriata TaxID=183589 RepID=A0A448YUZ4_9STRA|nr:unnamed protein product [Pseudo-nitzschia multistriata]
MCGKRIPAASSLVSSAPTGNVRCRGRTQTIPYFYVLGASLLMLQIVVAATSSNIGNFQGISFAKSHKRPSFAVDRSIPRGGALFGTATEDFDDEEDEEEEDEENDDIRQHPEYDKLLAYRMKQQVLLQLRATYLSETLAKRGLPIATIQDVATPEGTSPPQKVDWDCAMSTEEDPGHCLISYEPEPGAKLVVPIELAHTDKWITLAALNRLRRDDPSKVEPMWNDKYAVLTSWFSPNSRYSLLQHMGPKGVLLSTLLDGNRLPLVVGILVLLVTIQVLPIIEAVMNRLLVSGFVWERWPSWYRYVRVGLPFKLLILQVAFGQVSKAFSALVVFIKDKLVDMECRILEETIPLTVGVPDGPYDTDDDEDDVDQEETDDDEHDDESSSDDDMDE